MLAIPVGLHRRVAVKRRAVQIFVGSLVLLVGGTAGAEGPFIEAVGGLSVPAFQETAEGTDLSSGFSVGGAIGISATRNLSVSFAILPLSKGDVSQGSAEAKPREWSMRAYLLGLRYMPWRPFGDARIGFGGGLGITELDIGLADSDVRDQRANAFTYHLAGLLHVPLVAGLYADAELRWLITPTWRDGDAENVELENFGTLPILLQAGLGYRFDLF